ncbi:hypothetical protein BDN72DRAFT_335398 [Pluteus cervinus]|uniref:Uncharacterized protein n=1 Tax=Pluteus cervinus TaxID=181527 RepID=A0ACD3B3K2_9AGAR|nr:hypothetical protein BDN72DRAFT_335398 [Pluteus cervinus]
MRKFVHRLLPNIRRYSVNALAATTPPRPAPYTPPNPPTKTLNYVNRFFKETSDPTWHIVRVLHSPGPPDEFLNTLRAHRLSSRTFAGWMDIIYEPDIEGAVRLLKSRGYTLESRAEDFGGSTPSKRVSRPPTWLIFYLVSYKVHTLPDASGPLLDILQAWLHTLPASFQPHFLILVMTHLSRFNLLVPMRQVMRCFLTTPIDSSPELHFNLFLQALSSSTERSVELANIILDVLKTMEARQLKLSSTTYCSLLNDRFVTLQLTKYLHERMAREGFVPNAAHLEAYLRVFAKGGSIHDAERYREAIQEQATTSPSAVTTNALHRANVTLLAAQEDKASAFGFLQQLLDGNAVDPPPDVTPTIVDSESLSIDHPITYPIAKTELNIYSYSAMLTVVARDRASSPKNLLKLFNRLLDSDNPALQPTVATYTIIIRGLYLRKSRKQAAIVWRKLLKSGLPLDGEALSIGLKVLTRLNKPHEAFAALEKYCNPFSSPYHEGPTNPVSLTIIGMNEFLVSLNCISRPDLVFKMWDHMIPLYGIYPNSLTLSIVLQSVRLTTKLDDSFSGAMAHFAMSLRNQFNVQQSADINSMTREERVQSIRNVAGIPQAESEDPKERNNGTQPTPYVSGIWNGEDTFERMRRTFWEAMVGCNPHLLGQVEVPARAIRTAIDADPMRTFGLPKMGYVEPSFTPSEALLAPSSSTDSDSSPHPSTTPSEGTAPPPTPTLTYPEDFNFDLPDDLLDEEDHTAIDVGILPDPQRSRHPQISLTNANCFNYITLLGVTSNSPEIPLVLAWMRASGIQPSRSTIALALVLWAEVSIPAPIIESLQNQGYGNGYGWGTKGQRGKNEYEKLIEWVEDWVGEKRMPNHDRIEKWHKIISRMRDNSSNAYGVV